jgi:hypothetical protein
MFACAAASWRISGRLAPEELWHRPFDAAIGAISRNRLSYHARKEAIHMLIRGQPDIEIEISDIGYICLKQQNGDGDHVIVFAPAYASKVAGAINQLQEYAQRKFEKSELVED